MSSTEHRHTRVCVTAFIMHDGKALVAKRSQKETFLPGYYEGVGGKMEFGETPQEALVRELKEELGVAVSVQQPFHAFSAVLKDGAMHYIEIGMYATLLDPIESIQLHVHDEIRWVTEKELDALPVTPEEKELLQQGFRHRSNSHRA